MITAVSIILVIAVLVAGLLRDSLRTGAVTRWGRTHGFSRVPQPEHDNERQIAWAKRFRPDGVSHWGMVLRGETAGLDTTIAEHERRDARARTAGTHWQSHACPVCKWTPCESLGRARP